MLPEQANRDFDLLLESHAQMVKQREQMLDQKIEHCLPINEAAFAEVGRMANRYFNKAMRLLVIIRHLEVVDSHRVLGKVRNT